MGRTLEAQSYQIILQLHVQNAIRSTLGVPPVDIQAINVLHATTATFTSSTARRRVCLAVIFLQTAFGAREQLLA